MLFERDYEKAISKEYQDRIQKYIQGSDTRTVIDLGLFAQIQLNEESSSLLRTKSTKLEEVSTERVYEELVKNKFYSLKLRLSKLLCVWEITKSRQPWQRKNQRLYNEAVLVPLFSKKFNPNWLITYQHASWSIKP